MINLHNVGTFNANTRFKVSYLNELKRMLENFLPHVMLKAKPNLESGIRQLFTTCAIENTIAALGGMSIGIWLLPYMQKVKPLGKMLKQLQILLKK
ncbi:hypothetical protein Gogos_010212 [Gossypium gossypioides]|uniref:Uncharacterized protein n=1 Tax=Gossypium gossypioides TaxID=34282 RepID=A0A7J9BKI2_GOSGO|nr:hypothetical protein [Gossypium gossypioides]